MFDKDWYNRANNLSFEDILLLSDRNPELKLYEMELPAEPVVLDIGVGFGTDTAYFLSKKAKVDAVDNDGKVLEILNGKCLPYADNLHIINVRLPQIELKRKYDIIIISNVLHYLSFIQIEKSIKILSDGLNKNGFIIFRSHSKKHPYNSENHSKRKEYKYFFSKDDIDYFFPRENFTRFYISEYFRKFNSQECFLYGYDSNKEHYKNSITAILKKND